jgi:Flp pilus assembly protein CpaB
VPAPASRSPGPPTPSSERVVHPRRGLPGSRAVVGGLLVAVAALGTWWAASGAGQDRSHPVVVAARSIGPGESVDAEAVTLVDLAVPAEVRGRTFTDPAGLDGAVALGPIDAGEIVQHGAVADAATEGTGGGEVSFTVETDWAVGGALRIGDRIDVYATFDRADGPTSERVLAGAVIRRLSVPADTGFGEVRDQTITVSVADDETMARTVGATRAGTVTVVRVTGAGPEGRPAAGPGDETDGLADGGGAPDDVAADSDEVSGS